METELLRVEDLTTEFRIDGQGWLPVIEGVDLTIEPGRTLGIVGESGSGKSISMASILGLVPFFGGRVVRGRAIFQGKDLLRIKGKELRKIRGGDIGVVFQDPMTSLNPVRTIERQMVETIREHTHLSKRAARSRARELLELVRIPDAERRLGAYPHELSGGMRQRVMIAIALSCDPKLIIADEPTTALDVTVQVDVLDTLRRSTAERGVAVIIVSHDLGVISSLADRVAVMYAGRVIEEGTVKEVLGSPGHPYTRGLLESIPTVKGDRPHRLSSIRGLPPRPDNVPSGCAFRDRCPQAQSLCGEQRPILEPVLEVDSGHSAACHFKLVSASSHGPREPK